MTLLSVEDLRVVYATRGAPFPAVDGVDLEVAPGATLGLVGESGSGKSTVARAIVGLVPAAGGRVRLGGEDVTSAGGARLKELRRRVQLVFQDPYSSLNPRMTVGEIVGEALAEHHDLSRAARRAEVARLLDLVELGAAAAASYPFQFSGGQRQRIAIARALAVRPELVIADEITSALDVSVQASVLNLLRELQRLLGLSFLLISHNLAVVRYVSDVVSVMHLGKVVETAPVDALFAAPRHPYTRALLGSVPHLRTREERLHRLEGDVPDPHEPPPGCRFHTRCPVGPLVRRERTICMTADPHEHAAGRPHRAACHFAGAEEAAA